MVGPITAVKQRQEEITMTALASDHVPATANPNAPFPEETANPATRGIRHEYSRTFPSLLNQLGISLLVSTYQAGKVVAVGVAESELTLTYHNFERAMGLAIKGVRKECRRTALLSRPDGSGEPSYIISSE